MAIAHFFLLLGEGILLNLQQSFIRVGPGASFGQIHGKIVFREIVLKVRMTHLLCRNKIHSEELSEFLLGIMICFISELVQLYILFLLSCYFSVLKTKILSNATCYIFQIFTQCCNYSVEN